MKHEAINSAITSYLANRFIRDDKISIITVKCLLKNGHEFSGQMSANENDCCDDDIYMTIVPRSATTLFLNKLVNDQLETTAVVISSIIGFTILSHEYAE